MRVLLLQVLAALLPLTVRAEGETRLFNRWTIELPETRTSLEWYQTYRVGGIARDESAFYLPTPSDRIQKRSLSHGGVLWESALETNSQGAWSVDDQRLYGGDTKGNLYALEKSSGQILWKTQTKGVFFAAPLVGEQTLWVMNSLGTLQCYNKLSGEWVWQQADPSVSSVSLWSPVSAIRWQDQVIAGFPSALLQSFFSTTGHVAWKESFVPQIATSDSINDVKSMAVTSKGILVASSYNGDLRAWTLKNGDRKPLWQKPLSLYSAVTLSEDEKTIYASARDGGIYAFDTTSGLQKWKLELPKGLGTSVALSRSGLWVATSEGQVTLISFAGEVIASTHDYQSPIWNSPIVIDEGETDGVIFMTTQGIMRKIYPRFL